MLRISINVAAIGLCCSLIAATGNNPVAYHYDSGGTMHSAFAAQLAERLGANLLPVSMAQQQNGYDCGVFVVDGTRALVRRIAQGQWQRTAVVLDLNDLVIDRQALLNRLRTHPDWRS